VLPIVPSQRVHRRREAAALAARPQAEIDRERDARGGDVAEGARQALHGAAVKGMGVHALGAVGLRRVVLEHDEEVEV
jgi:hypothetical protein